MWRAASLCLLTACVEVAGLGDLRFEGSGGAAPAQGGGGHLGTTGGDGGVGGALECPDHYGDCDGVAATGCEVMLVDNAEHCGVCGHHCAPSGCAGTRCENAVIVTGEERPFGIRAAGSSVLWVASDSGDIRRCDLPDCAGSVRTLANSGTSAYFLSLDATHVYWNRNGVDEMWRCPLDGCIGREQRLTDLAPTATTSQVSGGYLYWSANEGTVRRVVVDGSQPPELLGAAFGADGWVQIDGEDMYWTTRSGGAVRRCQIAECQATTVDFATGLTDVCGIDLDAAHVYVSTYDGADEIYSIAKTGGIPEPLVNGLGGVWSVMALGEYVYWVEAYSGLVRAIPKIGGNVIELDAGLVDAWNLTHNGEFVFVADVGGDRVIRIDPL